MENLLRRKPRSNLTGAGYARILPGRGADGAARDGVRCQNRHLMQYMNSRREEAPTAPVTELEYVHDLGS